jgi:hypothetical protein
VELPDEAVLGDLVQRYARLMARLSDEIGERPLVLPNAEFFPDTFTADQASLRRLVRRMRAHAGLDDVPIRAMVADEESESEVALGASCCGAGSCAPQPGTDTTQLIDEEEGWRLVVPAAVLGHAVALATHVAQALGRAFLIETSEREGDVEEPMSVSAELAATALGFGALLLEGSYVYQKSCGGPRVARFTELSASELAVVLALFARLGDHSVRRAAKALGATQQAALSEALAWVDANRALVDLVRSDPERVARGDVSFASRRGLLARVFGGKKEPSLAELEASLARMPPRQEREPRRDPKRDELRELVAEALDQSTSEAE